MVTPFLGVKGWREFKTPGFNSRVMLIVILEFGNYRVRLMINKPTELFKPPKMTLFSLGASFSGLDCGCRPSEKMHVHSRSLLSATSYSLFKI